MPYHLYSSVLIYLIPTASIIAVGPSCLFLQTATVCSQHTCIILLHHTDTALTTQQTVTVWYRQFWTVCRRQQSDTAMISYLYQAWRCKQAVTALWRFCVCSSTKIDWISTQLYNNSRFVSILAFTWLSPNHWTSLVGFFGFHFIAMIWLILAFFELTLVLEHAWESNNADWLMIFCGNVAY